MQYVHVCVCVSQVFYLFKIVIMNIYVRQLC